MKKDHNNKIINEHHNKMMKNKDHIKKDNIKQEVDQEVGQDLDNIKIDKMIDNKLNKLEAQKIYKEVK